MAESADDPAERARWLTFALMGAGPTGVELAGQIREVATRTLHREYRHINPEEAKVLLFDGGSAPLSMFGPKLSAMAARQLGSIVTHVGPSRWPRRWPGPPARSRTGWGRLLCGPDLSLPGHPDILVAGDMMSLVKLPGVAEVAMQSGLYAGRRISREAQGQTYDKPFRYHDLGSAAYLSRGRAVFSAFGMRFGGFPGWVAWLFIHIGFLTGYRNRVGAIMGWWYAFTRDLRRERTYTIDDMPLTAGPYGPAATRSRSD
ncbi:MAG: NAD(P)/FAD-dependent oxidoreductase [Trebonia sp.]